MKGTCPASTTFSINVEYSIGRSRHMGANSNQSSVCSSSGRMGMSESSMAVESSMGAGFNRTQTRPCLATHSNEVAWERGWAMSPP